jgi:hypothetical protein
MIVINVQNMYHNKQHLNKLTDFVDIQAHQLFTGSVELLSSTDKIS